MATRCSSRPLAGVQRQRGDYGASLMCGSCLTPPTQCLCRRDLISDVHKYIKKLVSVWCGGKEVDVDAALKLYNDYCSANGFPIPGYTYISTKTVRATTATPTSSKESTRNVTATTPSAATTNSPSGARGGSPPTATTVGAATASTTAHPSSSSRVHPPPWLPLLALVSVIPFILGTARAQTLVVTLTESDLPSAFTSVVTTRQTVISEPIVSNRKLNGTESSETTRTESSLGISTASTTNDSRTDAGRADNVNATGVNGDLSQLEIAGIAIGIILGIITAIATVWMCIRARR